MTLGKRSGTRLAGSDLPRAESNTSREESPSDREKWKPLRPSGPGNPSNHSGNDSDAATQQQQYQAYGWVAEQVEHDLAAGRQPDADALASRYPHLAEELRQLVNMVRQLHEMSGTGGQSLAIPRMETVPPALGDFKIVRQIGFGGMGVVYEAEQISLGRLVALKVLPFAGMFTPRRLQRFKNEAMAAASLHHPHIVPVFAVGSERGMHYYAMQLIDGRTLADELTVLRSAPGLARKGDFSDAATVPGENDRAFEAGCGSTAALLAQEPTTAARRDPTLPQSSDGTLPLIDGPQWSRDVATLGIDVARALKYAHERGIVHRDIKPSNLLRDSEGKVWVTDFGLAQIETEAELTLTGDLLGTPRYMSPEQAAGGSAVTDHRTDIYSLGVTLYELLTLRPAYPGEDRGQVLRAVTSDTVNPVPIRRLNPSIPIDLQTIVNKAIAKEPRERYRSAEQLADDLQRFLDHKPIVARPATTSEQLAKWVWRHRSLAALAFGSLLFATLVLAATSLLVWREQSRTAAALKRSESLAREKGTLLGLAENAAIQASNSAREERRQSELAQALLYVSDLNRAHHALVEGDLPQLVRLLDHHVPQTGYPDVRGVEWYWLRRQAERPGRILANLEVPIYNVRRSPDGRWLAYAGADEFIYLLELPSWRRVRRIASGQREVNSLAFSPDGRTLASAGDDGSACLWDLSSGERLRRIAVNSDLVFGVAFTPDGATLATCGREPVVRLWDTASGQSRGTLGTESDAHERTVEALAISPDGRYLASISGDATARLWDLDSRECLRIFTTGTGKGACVSFSADGQWLATGNEDGSVLIWNLKDGSMNYQARHPDGIHSVWFDAGGETLLAGDHGGSLRRWSFSTSARGSSGWGQFSMFRQQGRLVKRIHPVDLPAVVKENQASGDLGEDAVRLLPVSFASLVAVWQAHRQRIYCLAGDPTGDWLVSAGEDGRLALWTQPVAASGSPIKIPAKILAFGLLPDGDQIALATRTHIQLVSIDSGQLVRTFDLKQGGSEMGDKNPPARPVSLAVAPDGARIAVGFADGWLWIVDSQSLALLDRWRVAAEAEIRGISFSPDSSRLVATAWKKGANNISSSQGTWQLDVASGQVLGPSLMSYSICRHSPQGGLLAAKEMSRVDLVDVESGRPVATLGDFPASSAMAFSPDGDRLATATGNRTVLLWDIRSRQPVATLPALGDHVNALAFSPDGRTLATGGDGAEPTVRLWNVATGRALFELFRGTARIKRLEFTRDGRYLAIRQDNGALHVFDMSPTPTLLEDAS